MYFIAKATHWEAFGFLMATFTLSGLLDLFSGFLGVGETLAHIFYAIAIISYVGWVVGIGTLLEIRRVRTLRTNRYYRFVLAGIILVVLCLIPLNVVRHSENWQNTLIQLYLFALTLTSLFIVTSYVAKGLKSIETDGQVKVNDYFLDILRIIFWPIGIWSIQLRVNIIFGAIEPQQK